MFTNCKFWVDVSSFLTLMSHIPRISTIPQSSVVELRVVRKHTFGNSEILGCAVLTSEEHLCKTAVKGTGGVVVIVRIKTAEN
jgi:hypothetical protein